MLFFLEDLSSAGAGFDVGTERDCRGARRQKQRGVKGAGAPNVYITPVARGVEDFSAEHVARVVQEVQVDIDGVPPKFNAANTAFDVNHPGGFRSKPVSIRDHKLAGIGITLMGAIGLEGDAVFRGDGGRRKYSAGGLAGSQTDRQGDGGGQVDNATNG